MKRFLLRKSICLVYTPVNEHFGITPLEAMFFSRPVIACNNGGPCETIEHGITGLLVDGTAQVSHFVSKSSFSSVSLNVGLF